jgi:hypothetical protein
MLYERRQIVTGREFYDESRHTVRIVRDAIKPADKAGAARLAATMFSPLGALSAAEFRGRVSRAPVSRALVSRVRLG